MSIEAIIQSLPNGFHDSEMKAISINYFEKIIKINLIVLLDDRKDSSSSRKPAELVINDFAFCVIDTPDSSYPYLKSKGLTIDIGIGQPSTSEIKLPPYEKSQILFWIWVEEWNGFIRIAAKDAKLNWI